MDSLREDMKRIHDALGDKKKVDIYQVSKIAKSADRHHLDLTAWPDFAGCSC